MQKQHRGTELEKRNEHNERYFKNADIERFEWLTTNKSVMVGERLVLDKIPADGKDAILEVGCGEGANIYNLNKKTSIFVGVDLYYNKLSFAKSVVESAKFVCADTLNLPFCDDYFDLVFCRDVLHHVAQKNKMIEEMIRVLRPDGTLLIIEANGRNPYWFFYGSLIKAEKGVKENTLPAFSQLFLKTYIDDFSKVRIGLLYIPMFFRLITHYKFGLRNIGNNKYFLFFANFISAYSIRNFWKILLPYIIVTAIKK